MEQQYILRVMVEGVHQASEIGEFSIYYTEVSSKCSVAYDYFLFRQILSCNVTAFSCY